MRMASFLSLGLALVSAATAIGQDGPRVVKHVEVYNEPGRFAGWPANNGIWSWDNEIVVGFTLGYHKDKSGHTIDPDQTSGPRQARSLDGGVTWTIEAPSLYRQRRQGAGNDGELGPHRFHRCQFRGAISE